jgi:NADH-quinone oxidoreductase subunit J
LVITAAFQTSGIAVMKSQAEGIGLVENLGRVLMTEYLVPFELTGILFISAMVGSVLLGKREKTTEVKSEDKL